jgi:hypothetical protein
MKATCSPKCRNKVNILYVFTIMKTVVLNTVLSVVLYVCETYHPNGRTQIYDTGERNVK